MGFLFYNTGSPNIMFNGTLSNCHMVLGGSPPFYVSDVGRGWVRGGGIFILFFRCPTRRIISANSYIYYYYDGIFEIELFDIYIFKFAKL